MNRRASIRASIALEERTVVRFADLPQLLARATHPMTEDAMTMIAQEELRLAGELKNAVQDRLLTVRPEHALARILANPSEAELQKAVLIPENDLAPYLARIGIELCFTSNGIWQRSSSPQEVAAELQKQEGWGKRKAAEFAARLEKAITLGELVANRGRTSLATEAQQPHAREPNRPERVRTQANLVAPDDVNPWLARQSETYRWTPRPPETAALPPQNDTLASRGSNAPRWVQRSAAQDAAILDALKRAGYQPTNLPARPIGKPGVKATIRSRLKTDPLFVGNTIFDKAWERLRRGGDICEAD